MRRSPGSRPRRSSSSLFPLEDDPAPGVVAGIDEAGLGPMLGPLTIGFSAFRLRGADLNLFRALGACIAGSPPRRGAGLDERLLVADSKVVFTRDPRGHARLEAAALVFLTLGAPSRRPPASVVELLARVPGRLRSRIPLEKEPWAERLPGRIPIHLDPGTLDRHVERIARLLEERGIEVACTGARIVPVAELNASFTRTQNKSRTHWDLTAPLLLHLWAEHARDGLDLLVDRHGGRMRYGPLLRETFPAAAVAVRLESPERSEYSVSSRAGDGAPLRMRIAFAERAEAASLPVALASCQAKYARELCMRAFNDYFTALQPELRPTAGYVSDGRRWLSEAGPALELAGLSRADLVRER